MPLPYAVCTFVYRAVTQFLLSIPSWRTICFWQEITVYHLHCHRNTGYWYCLSVQP